jgi:hypothetical protein
VILTTFQPRIAARSLSHHWPPLGQPICCPVAMASEKMFHLQVPGEKLRGPLTAICPIATAAVACVSVSSSTWAVMGMMHGQRTCRLHWPEVSPHYGCHTVASARQADRCRLHHIVISCRTHMHTLKGFKHARLYGSVG